jgi:hypothetical protein
MEEKRPLELNLPPLEDANAVMLWLMDVLRGLAEGRTTEKTAGIMLYGLQLAMVNARFTTFQDTDYKEMVRKAPKTRAKPQRTLRNTEEEASEDFTAKDAKDAKEEEQRGLAIVTLGSEGKALPQRTQRNTEGEPSEDFTAKVAKEEEQRGLATVRSRSEGRALPLRTQRSAEEEQNPVNPQDFPAETPRSSGRDFTAENADVALEEKPEAGTALRVEQGLEPLNAEGNPGVESAKSIFFGVEPGEGVADNRPVSPPPEPPRKSSQSEILVIAKDVEHHAGR